MTKNSMMGCAVATAAVIGAGQLASSFVTPAAPGASASSNRASLRGVGAAERAAPMAEGATALAAWGVAATAAAAVGRAASSRVARRAEPISLGAAAAKAAAAVKGSLAAKSAGAAKAAKAGKAATETIGAVGGSAGAGALSKGDKPVAGKAETKPFTTFDPAGEIGVTQPLGYFDPLGFCKKGDAQGFRQLRVAEIKHGRVAMMAALGAVVQHYVKLPGFEKVPAGLAATISAPGTYGFIALLTVSGILELSVWSEQAGKEPGNYGDPLGLNMYTEDMRNKELNNGRAAMFAAIGILAAELLTGKDGIEQLGLK